MGFFVLGSNIDFWETIYNSQTTVLSNIDFWETIFNSQTTVLQLEPCVGWDMRLGKYTHACMR